jgi:AhpD family alkylhydroperoxidase
VRLILWLQRRKYGSELEPARLWGRMPPTFLMLTLLYRTIDRKGSPIAPGLRSLIQVRGSQINWCAFCVDLNAATALERKVSGEKLAALTEFAGSPLQRSREGGARVHGGMTDPRIGVDDSMFAALRTHFDEQAILGLTAFVAFQNLSSKFNAALAIPPGGLCARPPEVSDRSQP